MYRLSGVKAGAAVLLALCMIMPGAALVSTGNGIDYANASLPVQSERHATARIGSTLCDVWIDGPLHESALMMSLSHDSGGTWSRPEVITGTEFNPMNVLMAAGSGAFHVAWQDGKSRSLGTCHMAIYPDGAHSKPNVFAGEYPSLAVNFGAVAVSSVHHGMMQLHISYDSGSSFSTSTPFEGLTCSVNAVSWNEGNLGIVASAGLRDVETGILESRGLYHAFYSGGSWSKAAKIVDAGAVKELAYDSGSVTWYEVAEGKKNYYTFAEIEPGIFGEKALVSSEEVETPPIAIPKRAPSRLPPKKWTFICYLDADNNLNNYGLEDINEMEMIGSDDDLNIIVLFDGWNNGDSKAYYIEQDSNTGSITSPEILLTDINPSWGTELNMGNPQTAIDFVNYIYLNYPADRYLWDMWNHGGSWLYGMCSDDTDGDDLTMLEVRTIYESLRADNDKIKLFDVAGYDECLMADVSNAYDEIPFIDYICNSEDSIGGDGWEYNLVLGPMAANPDMDGEEAAWCVFDAYVQRYGTSGSLTTMSIINSTMFFLELVPAINNLAQKGIHDITVHRTALQTAANNAASWQGYGWQRDLVHFCENIVSGLPACEIRTAAQHVIDVGQACPPGTQYGDAAWDGERAIIIHNQNANENGIKIYAASAPYNSLYDTMTFTETNWDEFYKVLWGSDASQPNSEPVVAITSPADGGTVVMDSVVTVTGTASDPDGTVQLVEVAIDTEHFEPAVGTGSWSFSWDTTHFALGAHHISARAFDGQDFSEFYTIQVEMVDVSSNGTVDIQLPKYPAEASVKVTVKDTDLNTGPGVETVTINVASDAEPAGELLLLTETGGDTSVFEGFLTISRTNGAGILWVNAADTITATYNDANYGGSGPMTLTDTAIVDGVPPGSPSSLTVEWYGLVQQEFFFEDFEGDGSPTFAELGWVTGGASNDWEIGTPAGLGGNYGNPDPTSAHSGSFSIGNDLTGLGAYPGDYEAGLALDSNWIRSPAIDCTGYSDVSFSFWRHLGVEQPTYDSAYIEVSNDGSAFSQVWTNTATTTDSAWTVVSYDISAVADNEATVYIRFEIGPTDGSWQYCGWNIDDLSVSGWTAGTQHNTVNWTVSSDDGAGADDVVAYNLYRSGNEAGPWDASTLTDTLPKGTTTYVDPDRGEFDGINWWYLVRAVDDMGNEDANTNAIPEIPLYNLPPSAPSNPTPSNGAIAVSVNPTLSVRAADPNGDSLTVSFYDASGPTLIGTIYNVPSGTFTDMPWPGLDPTTMYSWYATAYDGEFTTQSSAWGFTTVDMTPPGPPSGLTVEWTGTTSGTALDEDFSGGIPGTWTIVDGGTGTGPAQTWTTDNPGGRTATLPVTNPFAIADSDEHGSFDMDEQLITGVMDLSSATAVTLDFDQYFYYYSGGGDEYGDVDVRSSNTGGAWVNVFRNHGANSPNPDHQSIDISTEAAGASDVQVRFYYYQANYDWYWMIDNILVTYEGGGTTTDNMLDWTLSADDGAGADDVSHYNIYRSDNSGGPWSTVYDTVPAGTSTYTDPGAGEFDGINWWYVVRAEDIWGNEDSNTIAVPEVGTPPVPYDINLVGKTGWVFVSFPITISGNVWEVLNDAAMGDGQTAWDVAKGWDNAAKKWLTYRSGYPSTLTTIGNAMGVWLHLTANGGDQMLTTNAGGNYPPGNVNIQLYAGWNMAGYPSATSRAASDTLPPQATIVSTWQAASPYIADQAPAAVIMLHGNAYWIYVTADCTWSVQP